MRPEALPHLASIHTETWITGKRTAIVACIPVQAEGSNGKPLRFTVVRLEPTEVDRPRRQVNPR